MENRARKRLHWVQLTWLMIVLTGCVLRHDPSPEKPHPALEIPLFSYERDDSSALFLPYLRYRVLKHFREAFAGE